MSYHPQGAPSVAAPGSPKTNRLSRPVNSTATKPDVLRLVNRGNLQDILAALVCKPGDAPRNHSAGQLSILCPWRHDRSHGSFVVCDSTGMWNGNDGTSGGLLELIARARGITVADAADLLRQHLGDRQPDPDAEQRRAREDADKARRHDAAEEACRAIWTNAKAAPADHPYLVRKRIKPHHARIAEDGWLILPMGRDGELKSLQYVAPDGTKRFHAGASTAGTYSRIAGKHGPVYVAEGFATAATIAENTGCTVVIGYSAGQLGPATAHARTLADDVVIVADNDESGVGERAARAAAAEHGARWCTPPTVGQDANDYHLAGGDLVSLMATARPVQQSQQPEPEPLRRPLPKPFPVEALGPVLAGAVRAICGTVQCPTAVSAGSVLMMASLAAQGLADVRQDALLVPLSLFLLTVAQSGERKSSSDKAALAPLGDWLKTARKDHRALSEKHAAELKEHAARVAVIDKRKDGEGIADALLEVGQAPPAPRSPERIVADATVEGLFKVLQHGHQSQALASAEAGIITSGHSTKPDTIARWIGTLSLLWDGSTLDRIRADGARQVIYGRRLCAHLMLQPPLAEELLGDELMIGQGVLARFLICWPESTVGTRSYVPRSPLDDPAMQRYCARLVELLSLPLPVDPDDPVHPLTPRVLPLSPGAAAAWIEYANVIEREQSQEGVYHPVQPWASKSAEQALRLAGVLCLVEDQAATAIPAETMERAIELANWYLGEALRLVGTTAIPKATRDAEQLLAWMQRRGLQATHTALMQTRGPIRDKSTLDAAIEVLVGAGWLIPMADGSVLDGAPRRRAWRVWQRSQTGRAAA